jgi:hypothetical protein
MTKSDAIKILHLEEKPFDAQMVLKVQSIDYSIEFLVVVPQERPCQRRLVLHPIYAIQREERVDEGVPRRR